MAICRFCQQEFVSAQAVRAHLKGCAPYLAQRPRPASGTASLREEPLGGASLLGIASREGNTGDGDEFDPVRQLQQRITAEQLRLKLRELEEAHRELDQRNRAREQERLREQEQSTQNLRAAEHEREAARLRDEQLRREREQKDAAQRQLKAARRDIIQDVKDEVVHRWMPVVLLSSELKARMLSEIEQTLAPLPLLELPRSELIQIAQGVRDRLHAGAVAVEQRAQEVTQRRQALIAHGLQYARSELRGVEGIDVFERWRIEAKVNDQLQRVSGGETQVEVEDWVDEILEQEGIDYDDED